MSFARPQRKKLPEHLASFELEIARARQKEKEKLKKKDEKFSYPETRLGTAGSRKSSSRNDKRSPTKLNFKINEKGSPTTSLLSNENKTDYKEIVGLDLRTAVSLSNLRSDTTKDVSRVHELLTTASAIDCRADGVGSAGGHIARLVKAPGPHNGHNEIKASERLLVSTSQDSAEDIKFKRPEPKPILQPIWDKTFAYVKSPCQRLEKVVCQTSIVKKQVQFLCTKYYTSVDDRSSIRSSSSSIATSKTMKNNMNMNQQQSYPPILTKADTMWNNKVESMKRCSDDIKYLDLVDMTRVGDPDNALIAILGYICILLGLKPTWNVITSTIFSELPALFKLLKQLEPRSLPIKRLKKASKFKKKKITALTVIGGSNQKTILKILSWCNCVESLSQLIKKVHKSCKEQGKIQDGPSISPEKTENHSAIESVLEKQKKAHSKFDQMDYICTLSHHEFLLELSYIIMNDQIIESNSNDNNNNKYDDNSTIDTSMLLASSHNNSISSKGKDDYDDDYDNEFEEDDAAELSIKYEAKKKAEEEEKEKLNAIRRQSDQQQREKEKELAEIQRKKLQEEENAILENERESEKVKQRELEEKKKLEEEQRLEQERIEQEHLEQERLEQEREAESARLEAEKERQEKEQQIALEKAEEERRKEKERLEQEEREQAQQRIREYEELKNKQKANDRKALEALSLIEAASGHDMLAGIGTASRRHEPGLLESIVNSAANTNTNTDANTNTKKEEKLTANDEKALEALSLIEAASGHDMLVDMRTSSKRHESDLLDSTINSTANNDKFKNLAFDGDGDGDGDDKKSSDEPIQLPLQMGDRIEANYKGHDTYYPGSISLDRGMNQYDVAYDDGEKETWVPLERIRRLVKEEKVVKVDKVTDDDNIDASTVVPTRFSEGDTIEGNYKGRGKWYPGQICKNRGDGTYDINYDDGETEKCVDKDLIRAKEALEIEPPPPLDKKSNENDNNDKEDDYNDDEFET